MNLITAAIGVVSHGVLLAIERFGYGGVFVLMMAESAGLPIPSEIIMPFSGFLVSTGSFNFWATVAVGTVANVVGSLLFYRAGAWFGRPLVARWGAYVFFRVSELERAEQWFERWGNWAIVVSRMLPGIRTYISFPAGLAKMPFVPFIFLTAAGSFPWVLGLTWAGVLFGERWEAVRRYFEQFDFLIGAIVLVGIGWWVWRYHKNAKVRV